MPITATGQTQQPIVATNASGSDAALVTPVAMKHARAVSVWETYSVFLVTLVVFALFISRVISFLTPVTGDEPFYLMTAISMWKDHDLNECNNYQQLDEAAFYPTGYAPYKMPLSFQGWEAAPYPLTPHPAHLNPPSRECYRVGSDGRFRWSNTGTELYSKHGLGLSLMVMLPFVAGGRTLVVYFLAVLGAVLAANVYLFAREGTGKRVPAVLTWLAFAFTVPVMPYSYLIFPELPAALLILYAFRRIWVWNNNWAQTAGIGLCIAFLPWLHYRFIPVSAGLFAFYVYRQLKQRSPTRLADYCLVIGQNVVSAVLLMAFFYQRYGTLYPNPDDHAGISDFDGTIRGIAGLFLDKQWGLLVAAPIFILALVGLILMAVTRGMRLDLLWIGVVFVPYFVLVANYAQWWGEWCPPARYLASVLPLLALPFAVSLDKIKGAVYTGIYTILLLFSYGTMWGFLHQPQWMYNQPTTDHSELFINGLPTLLAKLPFQLPTGFDPSAYLPSFVIPYFGYTLEGKDSGDYWSSVAWEKSVWPALFIAGVVGASLGLAWWSYRQERRRGAAAAVGISDALPIDDLGSAEIAHPEAIPLSGQPVRAVPSASTDTYLKESPNT